MTAPDNYEKLKLIYDPNAGFGRNHRADQIGDRGDQLFDAGEEPVSDEGTPLVQLGSKAWSSKVWYNANRYIWRNGTWGVTLLQHSIEPFRRSHSVLVQWILQIFSAEKHWCLYHLNACIPLVRTK